MNKRNFSSVEKQNSSIHGTVTPADVRINDPIKAKIKFKNKDEFSNFDLKVWRLSPLGVELVNETGVVIPKGQYIDLELTVGYQTTVFSGLMVEQTKNEMGKDIIHIRLIVRTKSRLESFERRNSQRWICSDDFFPTAVCSNPSQFNDFIYFKVRDISADGFKLQTSLRNKFIIPGMRFSCIMNFPMVTEANIDFEVKNVRVELFNGRESLSIGVQCDTDNIKTKKSIGQYLMQFSNVSSLTELRESGFDVFTISDAVNYSFVRTKEEYEQVLKLRYEAYLKANKISSDLSWQDMGDSYDTKSRIVIGKFKGQVIVSARLIFNTSDDLLEQEQYAKLPADFPRRDQFVEMMRLCTSPDFRKSDLLISFFRFLAVTVAQSKREYAIACATDDLLPFYKKLGWTDSGISYAHPKLGGLKHTIIYGKVKDGLEGVVVDPITWNIVYGDAVAYLDQYQQTENQGLTLLRLSIYRWFSPIAKFIQNRAQNRIEHVSRKKFANDHEPTETNSSNTESNSSEIPNIQNDIASNDFIKDQKKIRIIN